MLNPFNLFKPIVLLRMVNGVFFLTGLFAAAVVLHAMTFDPSAQSPTLAPNQSIDTIITGSVDKIDHLIEKSSK